MRFLLLSLFDESSLGLRSVGAMLHAEGHSVHFLHCHPFLYERIPYTDIDRIRALRAQHPLLARDVGATGDTFTWARLLSDLELEVVLDHTAGLAPEAIGVSVAYGREAVAEQITRAIRRRCPHTPVLWGGVYPTLAPEQAIQRADIVCVGEGEAPLARWARDPSGTSVPGLWFRSGESIVRNEPEPPIPLASLPLPLFGHRERTLLGGQLSSRTEDDPDLIGRIYVFAASRGCRFDCSYCLSGRMRRQAKRPPRDRKPVDLLLREVRQAGRRFHLPPRITFWDDIFTDDRDWLEEFARRYPSEIGIPFACQVHYRDCTPRAVELLAQAGAAEVAVGLESGSSRVLRNIYQRSPDTNKLVALCHNLVQAGITNLQVDLITSSPFDTEDDCRETLRTLLRLPRPFRLEAAKLVIYPGSRLASYDGPRGDMSEQDHDSWNMLYLLAQYDALKPEQILALSRDSTLREHPERLRHLVNSIEQRAADADNPPAEDRERNREQPQGGRVMLKTAASPSSWDVLLVGAGPLPDRSSRILCAYTLRTAELAILLRQQGLRTRVIAADLFHGSADRYGSVQESLAGEYSLIPEDAHGHERLGVALAETQPRAILATSAPAAAMVCRLAPPVPIWADLPGWLMPEAQLKAATDGDDGALERYLSLETAVLQRADKISVVCERQLQATRGELALLRRFSRRTLHYQFLHRIPMFATDWSPRLGPPAADLVPRLPADVPVLLWSGSLNLWTDVDLLFRLLSEVMTQLPELQFVLTGGRIPGYNDGHCGRVEKMVEGAPFRDRCHLTGWLPFAESVGWMKRAGLGLCIDVTGLEAENGSRTRLAYMLAHGLPAAATRGTELVAELEAAGAVLALDPARPEEWASQVVRALESPAARERLRDRGRLFVLDRYEPAAAGRELLAWLRRPAMAPDNAFRVAVRLPAPVPPAIGPDAALKQARPMVTWRSQEEIDSVPLEAMSPGSVRRTARVVRRLAGAALDRPRTRVGVLAGWNLATRVVRSNRLASWQGLIDARMSLISPTPLEARLARGAGRRVYSRTLGSPCSRGIRKSVNVLAARHERDTADALVSLPQRIEIEPSSRCNIRCRMCQLTHMQGQGGHMPLELFQKVEPYFAYAPLVEFIGRGEPTLNPELPRFLEAAVRQGCYVRMFTNGVRLTAELASVLVGLRIDEVVLSLTAGTAETFQQMTGARVFPDIVENFRALREIKCMAGTARPAVSVCSALLRGSLDAAPDVVRTAASLGIPTVHFGAAYVVLPEMEQESLLLQDPEAIGRVFAECRRVAEESGVQVRLPSLTHQPDACPPFFGNAFGCLHPWLSVLVRADGNVEVCSYNRKIAGDLKRQSLGEIWNGPEFVKFRRGLVRHNGVDYCDMCYHRSFWSRAPSQATHFPYGISFDGYH